MPIGKVVLTLSTDVPTTVEKNPATTLSTVTTTFSNVVADFPTKAATGNTQGTCPTPASGGAESGQIVVTVEPSSTGPQTGPIIGGVFAGLVVGALLGALLLFLINKRRRRSARWSHEEKTPSPYAKPQAQTPWAAGAAAAPGTLASARFTARAPELSDSEMVSKLDKFMSLLNQVTSVLVTEARDIRPTNAPSGQRAYDAVTTRILNSSNARDFAEPVVAHFTLNAVTSWSEPSFFFVQDDQLRHALDSLDRGVASQYDGNFAKQWKAMSLTALSAVQPDRQAPQAFADSLLAGILLLLPRLGLAIDQAVAQRTVLPKLVGALGEWKALRKAQLTQINEGVWSTPIRTSASASELCARPGLSVQRNGTNQVISAPSVIPI